MCDGVIGMARVAAMLDTREKSSVELLISHSPINAPET